MLEKINKAGDIKNLTLCEKNILSDEIRNYILDVVSENGGHLASNLGVVELTIALHSILDLEQDKIIWDVGHQTYVHKILTGRKESLKTLRTLNGIAGFPKINESKYDCFNTGHSSTSISVALGMAKARDIKKEKSSVVAVIGDGALTGGMAQEALNDAGTSGTKITVILNDNEMSISQNVGGVNMFLSKLRTKKLYTNSSNAGKRIIKKIPVVGNKIVTLVQRAKRSIKQLIIPKMYFEDIGFTYLGPVDGHDIVKLENLLKISKRLQTPVLIHVLTKKGKGFLAAENSPDKFHATGPFERDTGKAKKEKKTDYSKVFGEKLSEIAKNNESVVAVTAAMKDGTGLAKFAKEYPERFFDVGIAEQHAIGFAAGLAKEGMTPVVPIYSSFYQRAYDQVIHDVCIQKLPVVMCVDRAGIVGADGETHQGIYDLSFFKIIPNLTIMAPKDFRELEQMLGYAIKLQSPVVIRYPRGGEGKKTFENHNEILTGKAELIQEGKDVTIIAIGKMVSRAYEVSDKLKEKGIEAEVINARFLAPIDEELFVKSISKTKNVITIEDNVITGGLGSSVKELILENKLSVDKLNIVAYPTKFIEHGEVSELEKIYGLDVDSIVDKYIEE